MYTPAFNRVEDRAVLPEAMRAWSFAVLHGPDAHGSPFATHLPQVLLDEGEFGVIEGHFALALCQSRGSGNAWKTTLNTRERPACPGLRSVSHPK